MIIDFEPTPIYSEQLGYLDWRNFERELGVVLKEATFSQPDTPCTGTTYVSTPEGEDPHSTNILKEGFDFYRTKEFILYNLRKYLVSIGSTDLMNIDITSSWVVKAPPGSHTLVHNQGHSGITGYVYLKVPARSGNTYFRNPKDVGNYNNSIYRNSNYSMVDYDIKTKQGQILMFPGWLDHGVSLNKSEEESLWLVFNLELIPREENYG